MGTNSAIEWTDHTFNPWTGCTKVSPGCANCYAETWAKRSGTVQWGPGKPRRRTKTWGDPVKWNRAAGQSLNSWNLHVELCRQANEEPKATWRRKCIENGTPDEPIPHRPRVFCASLADWLDDEAPLEWLKDLLCLIQATPNLDWLLLTKRPENFHKRISAIAEGWAISCEIAVWWMRGIEPANIWLGTTCENQEMADQRIPHLLQIPARIRFLSCEPLLGPVDLHGMRLQPDNWVICGGESGPKARPMHPDWARSLRDQCAAASVPYFFKQWGEHDEHGQKRGKAKAGNHLDGQLHQAFPK